MNTIVNPDIAYLLLMFGSHLPDDGHSDTWYTPAGRRRSAHAGSRRIRDLYLGFNWWALLILALALIPFIYSIRKPGREWALVVSILALILGSIYIIPGTGFFSK